MASTRLIVLKSKEIIYTLIFLGLIALLIIILAVMFKKPGTEENSSSSENTSTTIESTDESYNPGTYSSEFTLGESTISVMVTVNEDSITDVALTNLDESITTMYPLLESSMEEINTELQYVSSINDITYSSDNKYTTLLLLDAIKDALSQAKSD